jgi:FkbM family methyltransferase
MSNRDVIYDFGMNNGDDVEYYLRKGTRVVGVEANKRLCEEVERRFPDEVRSGRLVVLHVALSDRDTDQLLPFYIHKTEHVLSQLPRPADALADQFTETHVRQRTPASIIAEHGPPLYVKIDLEHLDQVILGNLFSAGIFPPEVSAESHSIEVFALMVANGYASFCLVDGSTVAERYGDTLIETPRGPERFSFKPHSAGPFGEDLRVPWEDAESFFYRLAYAGLGWKDIHASRVIEPGAPPRNARVAMRQAGALLRSLRKGLRRHLAQG